MLHKLRLNLSRTWRLKFPPRVKYIPCRNLREFSFWCLTSDRIKQEAHKNTSYIKAVLRIRLILIRIRPENTKLNILMIFFFGWIVHDFGLLFATGAGRNETDPKHCIKGNVIRDKLNLNVVSKLVFTGSM